MGHDLNSGIFLREVQRCHFIERDSQTQQRVTQWMVIWCTETTQALMEELQLEQAPEQRRLAIDSATISLKAALLHNGNKIPSIQLA